MSFFKEILMLTTTTLGALFYNFKSMTDVLVKSNEENLEELLEKPEDRAKFQSAVDELIKTHGDTPMNIKLNGKDVTISL